MRVTGQDILPNYHNSGNIAYPSDIYRILKKEQPPHLKCKKE